MLRTWILGRSIGQHIPNMGTAAAVGGAASTRMSSSKSKLPNIVIPTRKKCNIGREVISLNIYDIRLKGYGVHEPCFSRLQCIFLTPGTLLLKYEHSILMKF
jgi:hypothetical protein